MHRVLSHGCSIWELSPSRSLQHLLALLHSVLYEQCAHPAEQRITPPMMFWHRPDTQATAGVSSFAVKAVTNALTQAFAVVLESMR